MNLWPTGRQYTLKDLSDFMHSKSLHFPHPSRVLVQTKANTRIFKEKCTSCSDRIYSYIYLHVSKNGVNTICIYLYINFASARMTVCLHFIPEHYLLPSLVIWWTIFCNIWLWNKKIKWTISTFCSRGGMKKIL